MPLLHDHVFSGLIRSSLATCLSFACFAAAAQGKSTDLLRLSDALYKSGANVSGYERERCRLDVYAPLEKSGCPVIVWFHGGGLTGGGKNASDGQYADEIGRFFAEQGIVFVAVNYRFSPKVKYPAYIEDAAASVAWVRRNIAQHDGDPERVFVSGHSAGGYLAAMLGVEPSYLRKHDIDAGKLRGIIPISGQMVTHSTVRSERGLTRNDIVVDEAAPLRHVRADAPPFLLLYADDDIPARAEENRYFVAAMKAAGHRHVSELMVSDRTHGDIARNVARSNDPGGAAILNFISLHTRPGSGRP